MKYFFAALIVFCAFGFVSAQLPTANDPFPTYHPNLDVADIPANALPYYYKDPLHAYTYCTALNACHRVTYQYAFDPGRISGDNKSDFDLYFTDHWDQNMAPNGKPLVVILPGGGGNRKSDRMRVRALEYAQRGYIALVADYRIVSDTIFEPCPDSLQGLYALQASVLDARAAIRRALYLSSLPETNFVIDPTKLFFDGRTWGSLTSFHVAVADHNEFPTGPVQILGQTQYFADNLNAVRICEDPDAECNTYKPWNGYELKDHIKGVVSKAIYTPDLNFIDPHDTVPIIFFHGTCDSFSPFFARKLQQSKLMHHLGWGGTYATATCQDPSLPDVWLYGNALMYERFSSFNPGADHPLFYSRFFKLCGEDHGLEDYEATMVCNSGLACIQIGVAEYETFRFFAEILNGQQGSKEVFNLDHTLLSTPDQIAANHCSIQPQPGSTSGDTFGRYYPQIEEVWPKCNLNPVLANSTMRFPYFSTAFDDQNRYPLTQQCTIPFDSIIFARRKAEALVYNAFGVHVASMVLDREGGVEQLLQTNHNLPPGFYFVHLPDGKRKAVVIQ